MSESEGEEERGEGERVEEGLEVLLNLLGSAQARGVAGVEIPPDIVPGYLSYLILSNLILYYFILYHLILSSLDNNSDPRQYLNQLQTVARVLQNTLNKQKQVGRQIYR